MEKYKELIEKEATEYALKVHPKEMFTFIGYTKDDFIAGINSDLNAKLMEIEKKKYAVEVLESLIFSDSLLKGKKEPILSTLVIVNITTKNTIKLLEQQIESLENELK